MQLYDCKVRLEGSVLNEVPKTGVTAAEVEVLRAIHGSDAVVGIHIAGDARRSSDEERERLTQVYASPSLSSAPLEKRKQMIRDLFGHDSNPLPQKLKGDFPSKEAAPKRSKPKELPPVDPAADADPME